MPTDVTIFDEARAIPDPAGRAAYLDRACGGDPTLRQRVDEWLAADAAAAAAGFLAPPEEARTATLSPADAPDAALAGGPAVRVGAVVGGRYKLVEPVGEGGMGAVWVARQTDPVKRLVAVKLVKPGMDSAQVLARFDAERQALALMDHPNIARVLDAGAAADGRPFFVMELVKGVPITRFCDDRKLPVRDRLALFADVCRAVQHAHQKGVIHRDLKPSNVLVGLYDDRPVPKVIDFGLAKATGEPLTDRTLHTGLGAVVGTPAYMAPEQATLNNLDVDTRADVYGLGALLYELLTGGPPFARDDLRKAGVLEMLRVVREVDPPKPSARVSTAEGRPSIAAVRATDLGALTRVLRSDLDWVVMKALEKDRARRYDTAAGFAADVDRYLAGEAVHAAPPSAVYRARKFARRHRAAVAVGAVLLAAATAGVGGVVWAARERAAADRDRADAADRVAAAVTDTADRDRVATKKAQALVGKLQRLLATANPAVSGGADYTVRRMLDDNAKSLGDGLEGQPEVEADLRVTVGTAYQELLQFDQAVDQFQRAADLCRRAFGSDDPRYAAVLTRLASVLVEIPWDRDAPSGEYEPRVARAKAAAEEAVGVLRRAGGGPPGALAEARLAYGRAVWNRDLRRRDDGNAPAAAAVRDALALAEQHPGGPDNRLIATASIVLAEHEREFDRNLPRAIAHAERAVALRRELSGDESYGTAAARLALGRCYSRATDYARAEDPLRRALATFNAVFAGRPNLNSANALRELARALAWQYKDEAIEDVLDRCPAGWNARALLFPLGDRVAFEWGMVCLIRGDYDDAERHLRQAVATAAAVPRGWSDVMARDARTNLVEALAFQGGKKWDDMRAEIDPGLVDTARRVAAGEPPPPIPEHGYSPAVYYAYVLLLSGLTNRADLDLADRLSGRQAAAAAGRPLPERFPAEWVNLVCRYYRRDFPGVAAGMRALLPALVNGRELRRTEVYDRRVTEALLADSLDQTGDEKNAEQVLTDAVANCEGGRLPTAADNAAARQVFAVEAAAKRVALAEFLARHGHPEKAAAELEKAYAGLDAQPQAAGRALTRRRADVADRLIKAYAAARVPAKVVEWEAKRKTLPPDLPAVHRLIPLPKS